MNFISEENNLQITAENNYLRQGRLCFRRCLSVCLFVSNFAQKLPNGFAWNFHRRLAMGWRRND